MWLWRPRSPTIYCLKIRKPGELVAQFIQSSEACKGGLLVKVPKSEGLRTRNSDVQGQERWMSQLKKKETKFALSPPFVLFGPSKDRMMSAHIGEGDLLYAVS